MSEVNEAISNLMKVIMDTEDALNKFADSGAPIDEVADSLIQLHAIKNGMGDVYAMYSTKVMHILQDANVEDMDIAGARIEVRSAADRKKWNHQDLAHAVSRRLIDLSVDMDTGEVVLSPEDIANKMLEFVQPSYWRVKELAKVGINADNFCEVGDYKTNIIIRKAK
jgi:hypothetical protein